METLWEGGKEESEEVKSIKFSLFNAYPAGLFPCELQEQILVLLGEEGGVDGDLAIGDLHRPGPALRVGPLFDGNGVQRQI